MDAIIKKSEQLLGLISGRKFLISTSTIAGIWEVMPANIPDTHKFWGTITIVVALIGAQAWEKVAGVKKEQKEPVNVPLAQ